MRLRPIKSWNWVESFDSSLAQIRPFNVALKLRWTFDDSRGPRGTAEKAKGRNGRRKERVEGRERRNEDGWRIRLTHFSFLTFVGLTSTTVQWCGQKSELGGFASLPSVSTANLVKKRSGDSELLIGNRFPLYFPSVSYTHLTLPTNREV